MYSQALDFTPAGNQGLLLLPASGLNVTAGGGNGVFVFSTVEYINTSQCTAGGLAGNTGRCPKLGQYGFIQRGVVGNAGLFSSVFGTPPAGIVGTSGNIASSAYL